MPNASEFLIVSVLLVGSLLSAGEVECLRIQNQVDGRVKYYWPQGYALVSQRLDTRTLHYSLDPVAKDLGTHDFFKLLSEVPQFAEGLREVFKAIPFKAYYLEFKPLRLEGKATSVEWVIINAPGLYEQKPDSSAFDSYIHANEVVSFTNLAKDSILVIPPKTGVDFANMARFIEQGSQEQFTALWSRVYQKIKAWGGEDALWISTHGHGVPWLHVRLDLKPKYYQHVPFKEMPSK
jgi:hypothetical protein